MMQPQSDDEIRPFVEQLKAIDPLLDVVWDPQAVLVSHGSYSATGKRTDATYDGRWRVIRYDSPEAGHAGFHPERGYTHITYVTEYRRIDGVLCMVVGSHYEPLDDRLVELMRSADGYNTRRFEDVRRRMWAHHERVERANDQIDEAMAIEGLDRVHFKANYAGGVGNWQGKGADFAAMADAARTRTAVSNILGAAR